jgi:hypothetical protein
MVFGHVFHFQKIKQGPQEFILQHKLTILYNMEKDKILNNLMLIFPQAQHYSLFQNRNRASKVEYDVTKKKGSRSQPL